jgi:ATP-dependent DNA helicase RecG
MAAFRGAVANALIHRDYHRMGAVHVRLEDDALVISNPGGLVDGVTLANLLVTEPRPRNRALADAMKRIGVVERSGRGVDTICGVQGIFAQLRRSGTGHALPLGPGA